jgi:predicted RNase H-like HicB family nuclease
MENTKLRLNCVLIQDPSDGGYTAFFAEFPDVIAEGDNENEAQHNLMSTMMAASMHKVQEMKMNFKTNFITRPMDFELETA